MKILTAALLLILFTCNKLWADSSHILYPVTDKRGNTTCKNRSTGAEISTKESNFNTVKGCPHGSYSTVNMRGDEVCKWYLDVRH